MPHLAAWAMGGVKPMETDAPQQTDGARLRPTVATAKLVVRVPVATVEQLQGTAVSHLVSLRIQLIDTRNTADLQFVVLQFVLVVLQIVRRGFWDRSESITHFVLVVLQIARIIATQFVRSTTFVDTAVLHGTQFVRSTTFVETTVLHFSQSLEARLLFVTQIVRNRIERMTGIYSKAQVQPKPEIRPICGRMTGIYSKAQAHPKPEIRPICGRMTGIYSKAQAQPKPEIRPICGKSRLQPRLGFMARQFERREQDGAFVAGLVDCWEVSPGQAWWLYHEEPNLAFAFGGRVAKIDGSGAFLDRIATYFLSEGILAGLGFSTHYDVPIQDLLDFNKKFEREAEAALTANESVLEKAQHYHRIGRNAAKFNPEKVLEDQDCPEKVLEDL